MRGETEQPTLGGGEPEDPAAGLLARLVLPLGSLGGDQL
jgi:hypothetical protein